MAEGSTRFFLGAAVGAVGGFAVGAFAAPPPARSVGYSAIGGLGTSLRFLGRGAVRGAVRAADRFGNVLEDGYTRVRCRERYLEHEIEELREQITRLERKMD